MYPPRAAEIHCVTISQIAVVTTNVVAETPRSAQGEIEVRSSSDPSAINIKEAPIATKAPAMDAGHDAVDFPEGTTEPKCS
jgi:hypothetical protein